MTARINWVNLGRTRRGQWVNSGRSEPAINDTTIIGNNKTTKLKGID